MARPQKFLFDVSFDELDPPPGSPRAPEAKITKVQLEAARTEAFAAGRAAAAADAAKEADALAAGAIAALERDVATLLDRRAELSRDIEATAIAMLRQVIQRAVPVLCRKDPLAELEELVLRCLRETLDEPRLVLRVSDGLFDRVQARLGAIAQANGYAGKLVLLADETIADGDGRVEWADGGAERDTGRFLGEIDAILARPLTALPSPSEENLHD